MTFREIISKYESEKKELNDKISKLEKELAKVKSEKTVVKIVEKVVEIPIEVDKPKKSKKKKDIEFTEE